jgi:hypothetical protein
MRKIAIVLLLGLSLTPVCYGAPCYGTKMPKAKEFFTGAQNYTILKRYLEKDFGKLRSTQTFMLVSYGAFDWLSIDLKGGAGNIKQHPLGSDEIDYPSGFAGGYGFRLRIYESKDAKFVGGFQHISAHPPKVKLGDIDQEAILDDWQFSFLFSRAVLNITPYIGTRWSKTDYIHRVESNRRRKRSDLTKNIGLILGVDVPLSKKIWLNLEGQFLDSEAFALSLNYSF